MRWSAALSTAPTSDEAFAEVAVALRRSQPEADLAVVFASSHHRGAFGALRALISDLYGPDCHLVGCTAGGVLAQGVEVEGGPGVAVLVGRLPGVAIAPFHLTLDAAASMPDPEALCAAMRLPAGEGGGLLLLADPLSFDPSGLLALLARHRPEVTVFGGLASGGRPVPGEEMQLFCDGAVRSSGLVGVSLRGALEVQTIVAQGARPVGEPLFVTAHEGNIIRGLDGRPAVELVSELSARLSEADRAAAASGSLLIGLAGREDPRGMYGPGDFLIRTLLGAEKGTGGVVVGGQVSEGQIVQFHLRDAASASAELTHLLSESACEPRGALLVSCLGRGRGLYGEPHHDSACVRERWPDVAFGGFFGNGEVGPIHGAPHLHGWTSVLALFVEAEGDA